MSSSSKPPVPQRKEWDKDEWAAKARERDAEGVERAKEAEKAMLAGRKYRPKQELPKPTELMKQRTDNLELDKGVGKTTLVSTTAGSRSRSGGFYCEVCDRTFKDSLSYLDHVNGRIHLRAMGQTTNVARSTLSQVRAKIAALRAESKSRVDAKNFDFQKRVAEIKAKEAEERAARKEERKRKRAERRDEAAGVTVNGGKRRRQDGTGGADEYRDVEAAVQVQDDMASMMGFGGFGTSKKR